MGIEPTEDASQRPPPVLKTGPVTRSGRATASESSRKTVRVGRKTIRARWVVTLFWLAPFVHGRFAESRSERPRSGGWSAMLALRYRLCPRAAGGPPGAPPPAPVFPAPAPPPPSR